MKILLLSVALLLCGAHSTYAQCSFEKYTQKGIKMLNQDHDGFTFLKSYEVDDAQGKKYSYIFTQGTNYIITLANNDVHSKGVYVSVFDTNDQPVASSYTNGKFYQAMQFNCKGTGIYQLRFSFEGTDEHCAVAVLGMKR